MLEKSNFQGLGLLITQINIINFDVLNHVQYACGLALVSNINININCYNIKKNKKSLAFKFVMC